MSTLLCETVTGRSMAELLAARDAAVHGDMIELRLDGVADLDIGGALRGRRVPAVVTCRPVWEGGRFSGAEDERLAILARALELGVEFIDVEWRALDGQPSATRFRDLVTRGGHRIVLSLHDFTGTPPDLLGRARAMRAAGAGTIKVAVRAHRLVDTLCLRAIASEGPAVVIGMGEAGVASRLLAGRFGSQWTYAGDGVAPGQLPARRMIEEYAFRRVGASSSVFGVVSTHAMHSLSPVMHNAAFAAAGVDSVYLPLVANDFGDALAFAKAMGIQGLSVTIPFKVDALRAAEAADPLTEKVGAANTLRRRDLVWDATNTDVEGFLRPLESAWAGPLAGTRASVLGGGGAARAVVVALTSKGSRVTVHTRRREQAEELARAFDVEAGPTSPDAGSWDLLVNCTPLGGAGQRNQSPLPAGPFTGRLVYDLTYGPGEARLLRDARAAGLATLDGLAMLVAQAERQFEWWTGQQPTEGVMEAAARRRLDSQQHSTAAQTASFGDGSGRPEQGRGAEPRLRASAVRGRD